MSLIYLLDGYNIIKRTPQLAQKSLEAGREQLVRLIEFYRPAGSLQNSITIIFDGQPGMVGGMPPSIVKVIFTEGESADEKIKRIVAQSSVPKRMVVVTDDKDIKFSVRSLGAAVLKVDDFVRRLRPRGGPRRCLATIRRGGRPESEETKSILPATEYQITAEMEKIWLKDGNPK